MPKPSKSAFEETDNKLEELGLAAVKGMIPYPVMVSGVNRKINIGNFENIDVYSGLAVPVMAFPHEDLEAFKEATEAAAELGFNIASKQTGERYQMLKDLQSGGREKK